MARKISWERVDYESRTDAAADHISEFVEVVLESIDQDAARAAPAQWEIVRCFFAGCALAAKQQGWSAGEGGQRIAEYLTTEFDLEPHETGNGFREGFNEFMDWLSNPSQYEPTALRAAISKCG